MLSMSSSSRDSILTVSEDLSIGNEKEMHKTDPDNSPSEVVYKSYPERWGLLIIVALLNVANCAHWISFGSVNSKAAIFYQKNVDDITRIMTVSYGFAVPFALIGTYVVATYGLRPGILIGAILTFIGGLICCLSTFPGLRDLTEPDVWYWLTLSGQAITGIAAPFVSCLPTKISHQWFAESERHLATAVVGMATPIGTILGTGITPLFVKDESGIPILNIVWFIPCAIGLLLLLVTAKQSTPPTPPCKSAELTSKWNPDKRYLSEILSLLKKPHFLILALVIGGATGFISAVISLNEEIMCSLGYSNQFSGLCSALVIIGGVLGAIFFGTLVRFKPDRILLITNIGLVFLIVFNVALMVVMGLQDQPVLFAAGYAIAGFIAVGMYPLLLELTVETCFPIDESIPLALIAISTAIQGVSLMEMDYQLAKPITFLHDISIVNKTTMDYHLSYPNVTCQGDHLAKNHQGFVYFLNGYGIFLSSVFVLLFKTDFHRRNANTVSVQEKTHRNLVID